MGWLSAALVLHRLRHLLPDVLIERSARRHIERLHPAADSQDRHRSLERMSNELPLQRESLGIDDLESKSLALAVGLRVDVRPASGEEETVDPFQDRPRRPGRSVERRENQRYPAGRFNRMHIAVAQ